MMIFFTLSKLGHFNQAKKWLFGFMNSLLNIAINVSIVQQNQSCKTYMRICYIFINEFALEYNYNCKYCSTKSTLQNLHENLIVSIVLQNLPSNLHENGVTFLLIIVSIVHQTF